MRSSVRMSFPSRLARSILQQHNKLGSPVSSLKLRPTALVRSQHASRPGRSFGTGGRTTSSKDKGSRTAVWAVLSALTLAAISLTTYPILLDSAQDPPLAKTSRVVSAAEVRKHNSRESCWVVVEAPEEGVYKVWDVTRWLDSHPGGATSILTHGAGKDASKAFAPVHPKGVIERTLPPESFVGILDPASVEEFTAHGVSDDERRVDQARKTLVPLEGIINLDDFERVARDVLSVGAWGYYACSGDDGYTQRENAHAFKRYWFRPRILRPVEEIAMATILLNGRIKTSVPIYISPAARARMGHSEGERNLVRAASNGEIMHGVSCVASCSMEEMLEVHKTGDPWLFQVYLNRDRKVSEKLVKKAESMGFDGIIFTVDLAVLGNRELDKRAKLTESGYGVGAVAPTDILNVQNRAADPDMTWDDVTWLKSITKLPIIVKGIQDVEDVALAAKYGADAVVLSNHGGRSLDFSPPPIDVLYEIRKTRPELFDQVEVWLDGGVRRGSDVLKALCLGAKAVGLGRPFLMANGTHGQEGAEKVITIMKEEIATTMRLLGVKNLDELKPEMIRYLEREPAGWAGWRGGTRSGDKTPQE